MGPQPARCFGAVAMIVTTSLINKPFDALTAWPFIFVRPECKDDPAMIAHEMVHYKSMAWLTPFWWLRYAFSKSFRWSQEVEAYRVQIALGGIALEDAVWLLETYGTGHTAEQAREALQA